jgi:hypothetical protein
MIVILVILMSFPYYATSFCSSSYSVLAFFEEISHVLVRFGA